MQKIKKDKTLSIFFKLYRKGKNTQWLYFIHYLLLQVSKSQMFENKKEHHSFGRIYITFFLPLQTQKNVCKYLVEDTTANYPIST